MSDGMDAVMRNLHDYKFVLSYYYLAVLNSLAATPMLILGAL